MLAHPKTRHQRRRRLGRLRVRVLVGLVLLPILSVGFGWFVLRFGPHSAYAHDRRADVWFEKKEYANAIAEYDEAIRLDPQRAGAYCGRGLAWFEKKEYARAMADYNEAIRLDRRLTSAYCNRAAAWLEQNDYDKAIADYNEAIRLEPDSPFAYDGRANAWLGKQDYDKAINDYNEAIRLNSWVVQALGDLSESTNDSIKPLVSILAYAYYGRGAAWLGKNEYDKAIADYDDVLRLDPRLAAAYVCRGGVWRVKGDYVRALVEFSQAIRFDAEMASAYSSRAWIWAACPDPRLRDAKKAIESATKSCVFTKWNDADALDSLAAAYAEAGDFDSAVHWQTKAIAAPTNLGENHEQRDRLLLYQLVQGALRKLYRQDQRARLLLYQGKKPYRMPNP